MRDEGPGVGPDRTSSEAKPAERSVKPARHSLRALLLSFAVLVLVSIPLRILAAGWMPRDDVRRHAAKAVSGRDWSEILVLRPEAKLDEHPGWHAVLGLAHSLGAETTRSVAMVGIALAATLFLVLPLKRFRHPGAWLAALATIAIFEPRFFPRLLSGRPFVLSMATLALLLASWETLRSEERPRAALAGYVLLFAAVSWCHGNWYLWLFPIGVFLLAREWRATGRLAGCFVVGTLLGALATGHPIGTLTQSVEHLAWAMAGGDSPSLLVTEFQPGEVSAAIVLLVAVLLVWRKPSAAKLLSDPVFLIALLGWLLGLWISRFGSDWAVPALTIWIARELDRVWSPFAESHLRRALATGFAAAVLFLVVTGNRGGRWSTPDQDRHLLASDPVQRPWLPDPGGILYSNSMALFYDTFFENPRAPWRYVLGFEPGMMPPEELRILRGIQRSGATDASFLPWIEKLRPGDRLVIARADPTPPKLDRLEWATPVDGLWIGRPRVAPQ